VRVWFGTYAICDSSEAQGPRTDQSVFVRALTLASDRQPGRLGLARRPADPALTQAPDESGVGQRLRIVAEMLAGLGVHLLGVQAPRAGAVQQFGEQVDGLAAAVIKRKRFNKQE